MSAQSVTYEQALMILNDHVGEDVRLGIALQERSAILQCSGELAKVTAPGVTQTGPRDFMSGLYKVGDVGVSLVGLESVQSLDTGVAWLIAPGAVLMIGWEGA